MRWQKLALLFFTAFALASCAGEHWNASWPTYRSAPGKNDSLAILLPGETFTLMRAKWFSNKLSIPEDSSYFLLGKLTDSLFFQSIQTYFSNALILPGEKRNSFPEETQKLDERIFIRGRFPAQGNKVQTAENLTPKYLLLINEWILGTDLDKRTFFDYAKTQIESPPKKAVENISVIMTWTLWDNLNQRPLHSSILENNRKPTPKKESEDLQQMIREIAQEIVRQIDRGNKK